MDPIELDTPVHGQTTSNRNRRRTSLFQMLLVSGFLFTSVLLLVVALSSVNATARLREERALAESQLSELRAQENDQAGRQARRREDEGVIMEVLQMCRDANDIPDFDGPLIASHAEANNKLAFYVPAGNHSLQIKVAIEVKDEEPVMNTWQIPLTGNHGYLLRLNTNFGRRPSNSVPNGWHLSSSDPEFSDRTEALPIDDFVHTGTTWSSHHVIQYPNTLQWSQLRQWKSGVVPTRPLTLNEVTLTGKQKDIPCSVKLQVELTSEGHFCVNAGLMHEIRSSQMEHLLLPYKGNGSYEILPVTQPVEPAPR